MSNKLKNGNPFAIQTLVLVKLLTIEMKHMNLNAFTNLIPATLFEDIIFFISLIIFFLGFTLFYFYPAFFIAYAYFAKKKDLQGVKSHLIGGAVTGFSISIFFIILIQGLGTGLTYLIDNYSPFPPTRTVVSFSRGTNILFSQENIIFFLIFCTVNMIIAAGITIVAYELVPKIRQFFKTTKMAN